MRRPVDAELGERWVVEEAPVSFEYGGLAYAVMMSTPADLLDFAVGFSLSEGLVEAVDDILDIDIVEAELGWVVRVQLAQSRMTPIYDRIRHRVSDGGCGLCGIENLEQAMRLPRASRSPTSLLAPAAIFRALTDLRARQPLNAATGAAHAAAFCRPDGEIVEVREDVGRHNAFDKLIGALARDGRDPGTGFALLSSRCSYELVDKALMAGFTGLVTISAATTLAASRAAACGLTLVALARPDAVLVINDPSGGLG